MGGWTFLYPAFLAGAFAIAVPVVLHLSRRDASAPLPFSATRFLERAPVEQIRRRRLRERLLLALRVTALLLLAGSFARPYVDRAASGAAASVTVVAIDRSFSMGGETRFEHARALARDAIGGAASRDQVAVVAFDDAAQVMVEPTMARATAAGALAAVMPGAGGTSYRAALGAAAHLIGARAGRVVLVTDLQRAGWDTSDEASLPPAVAVEVIDAGTIARNLAVTAIRRDGARLSATVRQSGSASRTARAVLAIDGRDVEGATVTLPPDAAADVSFAAMVPPKGTAAVRVEDDDGLPADNVRYLVLDPLPAPAVLLVGSGRAPTRSVFYVGRALSAAAGDRAFEVRTRASDALEGVSDSELGRQAAVFVVSSDGLSRRGRERLTRYVEGGGGLLIAAGPDMDTAASRSLIGALPAWTMRPQGPQATGSLTMAPADARHPIFRTFGSLVAALSLAQVGRSVVLEPAGDIVARFSDGSPALTEHRVGKGRLLVFATDLNNRWNDLPLHPTFVPFVHETARYLAGQRAQATAYSIADRPAGSPAQPGVVSLGDPRRHVAVNVDPRESDSGRLTAEEFAAAVPRVGAAAPVEGRADGRERERDQAYWRYGLMTMLVALALEGLIGRRLV